jgi:hypothetical protein
MSESLPSQSSTPASGLSSSSPRGVIAAVFLASAALCVLGYLSFTASGPWFGGAPTLQWTPKDLTITRGTATRAREGLVITAPDAARTVVISINTAFRSRDYAAIAWEAVRIPDEVAASLLWYNDYAPSRVFRRALSVEGGRIAPAAMTQEPGWLGNIGGLALVLQGDFDEPIVVRGAMAKPMSPRGIAADRLAEWLAFEPWNGASINTLTGGADAQELPLPVVLAAIAVLGSLAYAALARWKPVRFGPMLGTAVAAMFLVTWVAIDVRWQWNLFRQVRSTHAQYGGKSWHERHLAAEDAPVFSFIEKVRAKLPAPPARVFMVADAHYFRDRGAYYLFPYNVYFDPWVNSVPPSSVMRPGDFIAVFQRRGMQYDPSQKRLRWDDQPPVDADLLLVDSGSALFRVR